MTSRLPPGILDSFYLPPTICIDQSKSFIAAATAAQQQQQQQKKLSSAELISMIRQGGVNPPRSKEEEFPPLPKASSTTHTTGNLPPTSVNNMISMMTALPAIKDDYGMRGLLERIKRLPADKNVWAIGTELESLNLALDSAGQLTETAWTPYFGDLSSSSSSASTALCVSLPAYLGTVPMGSAAHATSIAQKTGQFSDGTLFWIFYGQPDNPRLKDLASKTLMSRGWRYWRTKQLWLQRIENASDSTTSSASYLYWDSQAWMRRQLRGKTLPEESDLDRVEGQTSALEGMASARLYVPIFDTLKH